MAEADVQPRDRRGEWLPESLPAPSPLFSWPLRLRPALKSVVNFYWPYNIFHAVLAVVCWLWFTPDLSRTGSFAIGWIAEIYARNAVLIIVLYGTVHLLSTSSAPRAITTSSAIVGRLPTIAPSCSAARRGTTCSGPWLAVA